MEETQLSNINAIVTETNDQVMKLLVVVNSLMARLETIEKIHTSNNVASKRSIKTVPTVVTVPTDGDDVASVSSSSSKVKADAVTGGDDKFINILKFFKNFIVAKNYNNLRDKYLTEEVINSKKKGIKKPEGTEAYWISIGGAVWKLLDKNQKKEVRKDYDEWKKLNHIKEDVSQLDEEM